MLCVWCQASSSKIPLSRKRASSVLVANARGDAPPGCAFRDKTHGGSAGLFIEIIGQGGASGVCGWAGAGSQGGTRWIGWMS
jgi:hypothetical protein